MSDQNNEETVTETTTASVSKPAEPQGQGVQGENLQDNRQETTTVVQEKTTTTPPANEPVSTPAQDVVDAVHDAQENN